MRGQTWPDLSGPDVDPFHRRIRTQFLFPTGDPHTRANPLEYPEFQGMVMIMEDLGEVVQPMWPNPVWLPRTLFPGVTPDAPNIHGAFRFAFALDQPARIFIRILAASWYRAWLDGIPFNEGPPRFHPQHPEFESFSRELNGGNHVIALHVHYSGLATQTLRADLIPPFAMVCVQDATGGFIDLGCKCHSIAAWSRLDSRRSGLQGWVESVQQDKLLSGWRAPEFDDSGWDVPVAVEHFWKTLRPTEIAPVTHSPIRPSCTGHGLISGSFHYFREDFPIGFYRRSLCARTDEASGLWWRFDLGRVRLGRPVVRIHARQGSVVEVGMAEILLHGRVMPWVFLSNSSSIWLDRFVASGEVEVMEPHVPRGGRYLEIHAQGAPSEVELLEVDFLERSYFPPVKNPFLCGDRELEGIWLAGVETLRACSEDALVDTPVRERGQWTGDTLSVGLELVTTLYGDARLIARAQRQISQCAREDGLIPSLTPGANIVHFLSYALIWQESLWTYYLRTGDDGPLKEHADAAMANLKYFRGRFDHNGLATEGEDTFIDWGYLPLEGEPDFATCLFLCRALKESGKLFEYLNRPDDASFSRAFLEEVDSHLSAALSQRDLETLGYHVTALALREDLLESGRRPEALHYLKKHILSCFPNDPEAPRLRSPIVNDRRILTPYFLHFVLPLLIEHGDGRFAINQIRRCWGWSLQDGRTTFTEVFDEHWSHSHHWSACPTWILSQYGLGLRPAFHKGVNHWDFVLQPQGLTRASGCFPGGISVEWEQNDREIIWNIHSPNPVSIHDSRGRLPSDRTEIQGHARFAFPTSPPCEPEGLPHGEDDTLLSP